MALSLFFLFIPYSLSVSPYPHLHIHPFTRALVLTYIPTRPTAFQAVPVPRGS